MKSIYLRMKTLIFLSFIILTIGCSGLDYDIEKVIIDGEKYYLIDSKEDLIWLSKPELTDLKSGGVQEFNQANTKMSKWEANYIQTTDINFLEPKVEDWNGNGKIDKVIDSLGFSPIGNEHKPFTGTYNGKGFTIRNLYINRPHQDQIGMFGALRDNQLDSIILSNSNIMGNMDVGALVGNDKGAMISNCHVNGVLYSKSSLIGGVVGRKKYGEIIHSSFKGKINATGSQVGGIVGHINEGAVVDCHSEGKIKGSVNVGGIIGYNRGDYDYENNTSHNSTGPGSINNCSSLSKISADRAVGGIVGESSLGSILNCHFSGNISCSSNGGGIVGSGTDDLIVNCANEGNVDCTHKYAGGIIGEMTDVYAEYNANIYQSYSSGTVKGKKFVGGIAGSIRGNIFNSYSVAYCIADALAGGIVGELGFSGVVSNTYTTGEVKASKNGGAIAGEIYGTSITTKLEVEIIEEVNKALQSTKGDAQSIGEGIDVVKRDIGHMSYALIKNSYWNKLSTNQKKSVAKITYNDNKKIRVDDAKALLKSNFLKKKSFKNWLINTDAKDAIWSIEKDSTFGNTLPFLNWQNVVIQSMDDEAVTKDIIYNNHNESPILKAGYIYSSDPFFQNNVDTLCVRNLTIRKNHGEQIEICAKLQQLQSKEWYARSFAKDEKGNVWYGKTRRKKS